MEAGELNRLSCVRCKDRKVRCSRVMPQCDRCKAQNDECVYPVRKKRRSKRPVVDGSVVPNDALPSILHRLQRVEERCGALPTQGRPGGRLASSPEYTPHAGPEAVSYSTSITPSPEASTMDGNLSLWDPKAISATTCSSSLDATALLKDAVDHVQRLRLQTYSASVVTEEIDIPPELAKSWIRNYFAQKPTDMFSSLIDKKFVEMIPDMLSFPHVHLDACVIVIYYGVLWNGCSINTGNHRCGGDVKKWSKLAYLGCLRALPGWQREATGSVADLVAAISMARVAAESFDYEMAWKMFKTTCEYAQGLGMHNIDGNGGMMSGIHNSDISDEDRKAFWDLMQFDMFFRLILNKPPSISANTWKVNLPWLNPSSQQPPPQPDTAMNFLVSSRVTLLLFRFFAMLEESSGDVSQMMLKTEEMCREIKGLYHEWNLAEWAKNTEANELDTWMVADVALNGYTCIIFMLRKMATVGSSSPLPVANDTDIPDSPTALDAARQIVDIVGWLLAKYPNQRTLSSTFGAYRVYVPFAYVVSHILKAPDVRPYAGDIESLEKAGRCVAEISCVDRDFVPLARAIQSLNSAVRRRAGG